jgi:hypothetical protein
MQKVRGESEPNRYEPVSRLLIIDDHGACIYGRDLLERIAAGKDRARLCELRRIAAEVLVVYMAYEYREVAECREALKRKCCNFAVTPW